jgi:hypothetical protein
MHYLMLVTLTLPPSATSLSARQDAYDRLLQDDSFCGEGGRFGSPLCDWFVIGGRWSGYLKEALLGDAYRTAFQLQFPDMSNGYFPAELANKHQDNLNSLWQSFGGADISPHTRSGYDQLGYADDAMIVDQAVYDRFLAKLKGACSEGASGHRFTDLDDDQVDESFIGSKWIVVIDFHS